MLKIGHEVTVPKTMRGPSVHEETISIPEELETVPGIPQDPDTVNFYTRNYPLESHNVENFMYRRWSRSVSDIKAVRDEHETLNKPVVMESAKSGDIDPTAEPVPGKDVTEDIKAKALELGFSMVGIAAYDHRYTYLSKRKWVRRDLGNAICLAMEQPYEETQTIPSEPAEKAVFATYRREGWAGLELAEYIRSLGYRAQVQSPNDASSAVIPMFVAAGLGQQGASGYLLSPHFGTRHRLMIVTTDALVTHGSPVDFGIHAFCSICQVCVNRCPGRALTREKVWYRGVEKFKVIAKRCRPVMARYAACGVCMKVCPIQRYGLKPVMEHYASTGEVLGKGTHSLEGFEMHGLGYFGPGDLPSFDTDFFHVPEGYADQYLLEELKDKITSGESRPEDAFNEFKVKLEEYVKGPQDSMLADKEYIEDMDEF